MATALTDLLEIRHRVVGFNLVIEKVQSLTRLPAASIPALRNMFDSIAPLDESLDDRYNHAVTLLAGIDPILAFSLRSKHSLPKVLSALRVQAASSNTNLAAYEAFELELLAATRPTLEAAIGELARHHSFITARKVARLLQKSAELPVEASQFLDRLVSSDSSVPPNERPAG